MQSVIGFAEHYVWELANAAIALILFLAALARTGKVRWALLLAAGVAVLVAFLWGGEGGRAPWMWPFASLPAILIAQHAAYLVMVRGRSVGFERRGAPADDAKGFGGVPAVPAAPRGEAISLTATGATSVREHLQGALDVELKANDRYFSRPTIVVRYGVPAALAFILCTTLSYRLYIAPFDLLKLSTEAVTQLKLASDAARVGFAGAYVYVLIYLGTRTFRHDITSGGATWCAVVLALGPIVAITAWKILPIRAPSATDQGNLVYAYYFVAGLSPRFIVSLVEAVAKRGGQALTGVQPKASRTIPLGQIRGITPDDEERLAEEGVKDVASLAMADPQRLLRNTPYDLRQIVSWIDEAILVISLPQGWDALQRNGVTGSIDLAWYQGDVRRLAPLATAAQITIDVLAETSLRLYEDAQVQRVWVLYQMGSSEIAPGGAV